MGLTDSFDQHQSIKGQLVVFVDVVAEYLDEVSMAKINYQRNYAIGGSRRTALPRTQTILEDC